jgi:hypothetical protein
LKPLFHPPAQEIITPLLSHSQRGINSPSRSKNRGNSTNYVSRILTMSRGLVLAERWNSEGIKPAAGSRLSVADALNDYEKVSQLIHNFVVLGLDNIQTTLSYIEKSLQIPLIGLYSMIRASIEASSNGLWLLQSGTTNKLAWRGFQRTYMMHEDFGSLERALGVNSEIQAQRQKDLRKRLLQLQHGIPTYRTNNIAGIPKMTQIIQEADKSVRERFFFTGIQAWKACSGMAHGNFQVARVMWEHVQQGEGQDGDTLEVQFRSRLNVTASFASVAIENLEALLPLYDEKCKPIWSPRRQS